MTNKALKILVIDDDYGCRWVTARFLTRVGGHMVETAENGGEGLKKAAQRRPDIILLDIRMPDMNGFEVMEALCGDAATRDIPVIIVTGDILSDAELDSLKVRRNFLLLEQKPVSFRRLLGKIEAALLPGGLSPEKREAVSGNSPEPA